MAGLLIVGSGAELLATDDYLLRTRTRTKYLEPRLVGRKLSRGSSRLDYVALA